MSNLGDPRVLFAAERTLLAWTRTSVSLMAFGFVIERSGLFLEIAGQHGSKTFQRHMDFLVGVSFILVAAFIAIYSVIQYRRILKSLRPMEIPEGYNVHVGMAVNGLIGLLGLLLSLYLLWGFL
jgi:putative membrane protein